MIVVDKLSLGSIIYMWFIVLLYGLHNTISYVEFVICLVKSNFILLIALSMLLQHFFIVT